jgi:membrane protein implicated in regulation of membrane protease activity
VGRAHCLQEEENGREKSGKEEGEAAAEGWTVVAFTRRTSMLAVAAAAAAVAEAAGAGAGVAGVVVVTAAAAAAAAAVAAAATAAAAAAAIQRMRSRRKRRRRGKATSMDIATVRLAVVLAPRASWALSTEGCAFIRAGISG